MWSGPLWHPALEVVGPLVSSSPESPSPTDSDWPWLVHSGLLGCLPLGSCLLPLDN